MEKRNRFKKFLFGALGIVGVMLILYPFLPQIMFFFQSRGELELPYESQLTSVIGDSDDSFVELDAPIPEENRLVIPKIGVDVEIVRGNTDDALLRGAWHRPNTGDPELGGNFVITGHRFQYMPPNNTTFYSLDKLTEGDVVIVYYNGVEYDYTVTESFIVLPDQLEVESDLGYDVVTLYTCTPIWTSSKRLVVRALPIQVQE